MRKRKEAAALGDTAVSASARLGGNLVYKHGVGVQDKQPPLSASAPIRVEQPERRPR